MKYPAYDQYKESNVPWLGKIPAKWDVKRIQYISRMKSGESITAADIEEAGAYPVYGGNGKRGYSDHYTHNGEYVLIGRQGALCGNVHHASGKFLASEHALVVSPTIKYNSRWLNAVLEAMNLNQYSVSAAQPGLSVDNIAPLKIAFPAIAEQEAIAAFLEIKTAEIDTLIGKKEELMDLLAEQRTALITQAVTKGINPKAPMKDSRIDGIDTIPNHWNAVRLRFLLSEPLKYGANEVAEFEDRNDPRYIRITDVKDDGTLKEDTFRSLPEDIARPYLLDDGDILLARSGATVGKTFIYRPSWGRAAYAGYLIRARINKKANPDFIFRFLNSKAYWIG